MPGEEGATHIRAAGLARLCTTILSVALYQGTYCSKYSIELVQYMTAYGAYVWCCRSTCAAACCQAQAWQKSGLLQGSAAA
jgi:hypothetical protein